MYKGYFLLSSSCIDFPIGQVVELRGNAKLLRGYSCGMKAGNFFYTAKDASKSALICRRYKYTDLCTLIALLSPENGTLTMP